MSLNTSFFTFPLYVLGRLGTGIILSGNSILLSRLFISFFNFSNVLLKLFEFLNLTNKYIFEPFVSSNSEIPDTSSIKLFFKNIFSI